MIVKIFNEFFPIIKGLCEELKENVNNNDANTNISPESCMIYMESFEACKNIISTYKASINRK